MSAPGSAVITTRRALPGDAGLLALLGESTFVEAFAADNTPENMALYLPTAFGEPIQRAELEDMRHTVFIAERHGEPAGYVLLRVGSAPAAVVHPDAVEIVRLYVVSACIGSGVGAALMSLALGEARRLGKAWVWLGVWEHNLRAQVFYRRWQFEDVGSHTFVLGHDRQTDRLFVRRVDP